MTPKPLSFLTKYTQWSSHWSHGGTGVTKLPPDSAAFFKKCVEEFGDPQIFLSADGLELHTVRPLMAGGYLDLSDFWDHFSQMENNSTKI